MLYPAKFEKEGNSYNVTFRDIPEAITCGDDWEDALVMAEDALLVSMDFYFEDKRPVPMPSALQEGEYLISLPLSVWSKVLLLNTMIEQNISNVELAKRIHVKPQEVQRITNLEHSTKIDTIARALKALGKQPVFSIA
ncbi:MAG: type II toxin-antitoxin system HicB family antitoxin [Acinetobacter sp.]